MSLIQEWLSANYPNMALPDATRAFLLEQVGSSYSYLTIPELWSVYFDQQGILTGAALPERFNVWFDVNNADPALRHPLLAAGVGGGTLTQRVQRIYQGGLAGLMYDMTDAQYLFQDSARTTPVTATSQPIGSATDLSGNSLHANAASDIRRPTFDGWAAFDGTNTALSSASLNLTGTDKVTVAALVYWNVVPTSRAIASFGSAAGSFLIQAEADPYPLRARLTGNAATAIRTEAAPFVAVPRASVILVSYDLAGADITSEIDILVNGEAPPLVNSGATAGGGNMGNFALHLGAFGGSSLFFPGRIARFAVFGRSLSATEKATVQSWAGEPIGFFL